MEPVPNPDTLPLLEHSPYDNDVTALYKFAYNNNISINHVVVRPRTPADQAYPGTPKFVFEDLYSIVHRLRNDHEPPSSVFDIISNYNQNIRDRDILMQYVLILFNEGTQPPNTDNILKEINKIARQMNNALVSDMYDTYNTLEDDYDAWVIGNNSNIKNDMKKVDSIVKIQEELSLVSQSLLNNPIEVSPVDISTTTRSFTPYINERPVTEKDGIDIFNDAIVSTHVPFIQYNDEFGKQYYRVYTGGKSENGPNYENTIIQSSKTPSKNTIYMSLWLGDPNDTGEETLHNSNRGSFYLVIYRLDTNYLEVKSSIEEKYSVEFNEDLAYNRTRDALPSIDLRGGIESRVGGAFDIWGIQFDETSFVDMILNEHIMNVYLYIEESKEGFAMKKRLDVHYRSIYSDISEGKTRTQEAYIANSASVSVTLSMKATKIKEKINIVDGVTGLVSQREVQPNYPYIRVNIPRADSRETVDEFISIFRLLMRYYLNNKDETIAIYNEVLPGDINALNDLIEGNKKKTITNAAKIELKEKFRKNNKKVDHLTQLKQNAPDVFVENYARIFCQAPFQPIIISPDEVEMWKNKRVPGTTSDRQIMSFPSPENPKYLIVCPDDRHSYPTLKQNFIPSNRDQYPYVPCCGMKNRLVNGRFIEAETKLGAAGAAKAEKLIGTPKIVAPNKRGTLPEAVTYILKRYSPQSHNMHRYGVEYSTNSMLHCVCIAVDDPLYLNLVTAEQKESYVSRLRQYIANTVNLSLLRQELYDYSDEEIKAQLGNSNIPLSPALFYRAVEEIYKINIYVFIYPPSTGDENEQGAMEIPRHRIFHSRPIRVDRPTVVLSRTEGAPSKMGVLDYPQYELVVDFWEQDKMKYIIKLFGADMTDICHNTLQETIKTFTWSNKDQKQFDVHANIYYHIDHPKIIPLPLVSQMVDSNGKVRAFTFKLPNTQLITVATLPSQPENVPMSSLVQQVEYDVATRMFGVPTAITKNLQGLTDGLWFMILDITYGEYVPIVPKKIFEDKPIGPPNPLITSGKSITERLGRLRRTLNIITQLIRWVYDLSKRSQTARTAEEFIVNYISIDTNPVADSSSYYDLTHIPRILPQAGTPEEAIRHINTYAPKLSLNGRIIMYNSVFLERILKMLKDYDTLNYGLAPVPKDFIENYFESESDYKHHPGSLIFTNEKDMALWRKSLKGSIDYNKFFSIRKKITVDMGLSLDPYIYQDSEGKIFIIQNVIGGIRGKAFAVADYWEENRVNIGSNPGTMEHIPKYMMYTISPSSTLIPTEDKSEGGDEFLQIIFYGQPAEKLAGKEARYGAMLRIL